MKTHTPAVPASTTWTCDRCGTSATVHANHPGDQVGSRVPSFWNYLDFRQDEGMQKHICPACSAEAVKPKARNMVAEVIAEALVKAPPGTTVDVDKLLFDPPCLPPEFVDDKPASVKCGDVVLYRNQPRHLIVVAIVGDVASVQPEVFGPNEWSEPTECLLSDLTPAGPVPF